MGLVANYAKTCGIATHLVQTNGAGAPVRVGFLFTTHRQQPQNHHCEVRQQMGYAPHNNRSSRRQAE
jgi:hypothetical protein